MLKGYRTIIFNAIAALVVVADVVVELGYIPGAQVLLPDAWEPIFPALVVFANVILRFKTTTPVGRRA